MHLTPEYLLSHGFFQYHSKEEGDCCDIPFYNQEDLHFREVKVDRQIFVVIFSEREALQEDSQYHVSVFVQEDVGCGFIETPFPWYNLSVEHFESVYYGIRGVKPQASLLPTS